MGKNEHETSKRGYVVTLRETVVHTFNIEAESKADAEEEFERLQDNGSLDYSNGFVTENEVTSIELENPDPVDVFCEVAEQLGWNVDIINGKEIEIENWSPAGEDLIYSIFHDGTSFEIERAVYALYDSFDEEEHVNGLVAAKQNGFEGVPSTARLVEDADSIANMLHLLSVNTINAFRNKAYAKIPSAV